MRNFYLKMVLFVLGVIFCIFFGVDLASRGMERIEAPAAAATATVPPAAAASAAQTDKTVKAAIPAQTAKPPAPEPQRVAEDNDLNYVGNKLGDLLQIAAHHTIRFVVSLFETLTG
jgi:hypothetical protein